MRGYSLLPDGSVDLRGHTAGSKTCLFLRISAGVLNQFPYLFIKSFRLHQLLQREVHPVSPIMARVRRNVDTLFPYVRVSQLLVDGKPVLQRQDAEHGAAAQMISDYFFA